MARSRKAKYTAYLNSPQWKAKRVEALDHYGRICSKCGGATKLEVHHKHYRNFKDEKLDDLEILCRTCHQEFHRRKREKRAARRALLGKRMPNGLRTCMICRKKQAEMPVPGSKVRRVKICMECWRAHANK